MVLYQRKYLLGKEMQGASSERAPGGNDTSHLSDSAKSRKNLHSHVLLATFCNLFEKALRDESGDPGWALPLVCCAILNGPRFAPLLLEGFQKVSPKVLISNTKILWTKSLQ